MPLRRFIAICTFAVAFVGPAAAEVTSVSPQGFVAHQERAITASPAEVYALLTRPALWWSSAHSFSGEAKNFTLNPVAGGCFCETLPDGGSVEHLRVVHAAPGQQLVLRGGLGPLQPMGVVGAMAWTVAARPGGAALVFSYAVGGHAPEGFDAIAPAVDFVLGEQIDRLKRAAETGAAE